MPSLETPLWEIVARASAVYLILAIILRVIPKRHMGSLAPNDLVAVVIIGGLTADAIAVGSLSTTDLLLMIGVVFLWDYILNWLEFRVSGFRRVAQDTPTLLIHDGRLLRKNLERELMTEEELSANLRKQGILDVDQVRVAVLEVDGQISVVTMDGESGGNRVNATESHLT